MTIIYPCDSGSISVGMTEGTGYVYQGVWNIPSDATYGEYQTRVTAEKDGEITIFEDSFYILPWNIIQQIRSTSGIKQSNDIDDNDIALIAWNAYLEAREDAFLQHIDEKSRLCNDDTYYIKKRIVTDHLVCDEEAVTGYYYPLISNCCSTSECSITILDSTAGEIEVKDEDGDSLNACSIYVSYRTKSASFSEMLFKKAVIYLATHEVILRFNELDKATLADLRSNSPIILANPKRFLDKYKTTMKRIKTVNVGGI
jgi:hypothetical protein